MRPLKVNINTALILHFLIALMLFTACRFIFYFFNYDHYQNLPFSTLFSIFYGGIIFDISGLMYLLSLYLLSQIIPFSFRHNEIYQKTTSWLYIVPLSLGVMSNLVDTVYYQITLKRTTLAIFKQFSHETNLGKLFLLFIWEYWYITILAITMVFLIYKSRNLIGVKAQTTKNRLSYFLYSTVLFIVYGVVIVIGIRGGYRYSSRPITLSNAAAYISKPNQRVLVLNTPFSLIRTINESGLIEVNYFSSQQEQEKIFSAFHFGNKTGGFLQKKNVVLFILESFGREHVGALNRHIPNYKGFTPFVDSLIDYSYTFKYAFANGQKSISGMTSNIVSIPSLVTPFVLSPYSGNNISGLASVLKEKGYYTAFFHGAPNGSMGFDAFAKQSDFVDYFGMDEYANEKDYDGYWGIWDEEFFQYYAKEIEKIKKPFFTAIFSVSSHHPFNIPEKYKGKFPEGKLPLQKTIGYTDYSLKQFFKTASKMPWYKNTIFIFTADHSSTYNENSIKEYKTPAGIFSIPIIIYDPSNPELIGFDDSTVVQQIDIMPTILNLMGYPEDYISFGNDMLNKNVNHFAITHNEGIYELFMNEYLIQFDGDKTIGFYNYRTDPHLLINLMLENSATQKKMLKITQAIIQEYNRRMIRDELTLHTNKKPLKGL